MGQRNIHGKLSITFENQILETKVTGATNTEAAQAWLKEVQDLVHSQNDGEIKPWVIFADNRHWDTSPTDAQQANSELVKWMSDNNCLLFAFLLSKKLQKFALETQVNDTSIMQYFFDYDEAYQACLDKLAKAQSE